MEIPKLQWGGAQVDDGVLVIEVAGDRPKGWKATFQRTVALLDSGRWGEVSLKGATVRVSGVQEGSEESLHHFLESVMQEANAALVDEADAEDENRDEETADDVDDADGRMTDRFRGFNAA